MAAFTSFFPPPGRNGSRHNANRSQEHRSTPFVFHIPDWSYLNYTATRFGSFGNSDCPGSSGSSGSSGNSESSDSPDNPALPQEDSSTETVNSEKTYPAVS